MRPKLVILVALLAAILGAGSCIGIVMGVFSARNPIGQPGILVTATLLLPLATIVVGSIFVYRHTAKRRKLQAFITAVLATVLTLAIFLVATILTASAGYLEPPKNTQPNSTT